MDWLNYHHLLYFWTVAKEGGVGPAAKALRLTQPTISGQMRTLEHALGLKLFERVGRKLELTEEGRMVYRYADEIFGIGRELMGVLRGIATERPRRLHVGTSAAISKLVVHRLLAPVLRLPEPVAIVCHKDRTDRLLAQLANHELDLVLADGAVGGDARTRAHTHFLGECGVSFLAAPRLATEHRRQFPESLKDAPMLLPTQDASLRRSLEHWFDARDIQPRIIGELNDNSLIELFGQAGDGIFAAPSVIENDLLNNENVEVVGRTDELRERFYAVTIERRIKHPAIQAISESAKGTLFDG